ncbi:MAG: ABC transporter ATP-binding protein [Clostridiales bacterium]|nr:ABC transporter ATP-binding protein [Clostridiales bacterium]
MSERTVSENGKKWLKKEMRPYRAFIFFLAFLSAFTTGLSLTFAYMVRYLINSASAGEARLLLIFALVLLGVLLLKIALQTFSGYYSEKLRAKIVAELRVKLFSKILRSDYSKVHGYHSGDLLNRLTTDIQEVATDTVGLLPAVVGMAVQLLGAVVALLTIDPLFTAIYIVSGGLFAAITAFFRKQIKKRQKAVLESDGETRAFMQESISSTMTLKAYGAESKTSKKASALTANYYDKRMSRNRLRSLMSAVFSLLSNFGLIFAVVWCSISVLNGNVDYGSILSVILLLMQLQHPLTAFSSVLPVYYARITSGERLDEIESIPCETIASQDESKQLYDEMQGICFDNVTFNYGRESVLCGANIYMKKGDIVCLTGASGAGKSTVFKLLLNVFFPSSGSLALQGEFGDSAQVPLTAKERSLFAYVPQGHFMFSGTIYENLTFFASETDEKRLREKVDGAIETACAEFVYDLPQGLQTPLSEGGGGLSEGQTQRLAVARALLSERPILLLDEATSALDGETEQRMLENIRALKNKTCLIVTHRPAALALADKILVVENGKIFEKE